MQEKAKATASVLRVVKSKMALRGDSPHSFAVKMRWSDRTYFRKMKQPETITLGEIEKMERILGCRLVRREENDETRNECLDGVRRC